MFDDHESGAGGRHEDAAGKGQGIESFVALVQRFDPGVEVAAQRADGELGGSGCGAGQLGVGRWRRH
ncbi:hypothetical protein OG574_37880 [Streptomyces sp. NBC_01445]|nr:hypothetical protein [Streptomyces sp. NBC_01445]WSE08632.1 hypothetical protein OG574_37880 [Streptomyces sp. NBC_01445]